MCYNVIITDVIAAYSISWCCSSVILLTFLWKRRVASTAVFEPVWSISTYWHQLHLHALLNRNRKWNFLCCLSASGIQNKFCSLFKTGRPSTWNWKTSLLSFASSKINSIIIILIDHFSCWNNYTTQHEKMCGVISRLWLLYFGQAIKLITFFNFSFCLFSLFLSSYLLMWISKSWNDQCLRDAQSKGPPLYPCLCSSIE